MTAAVNRPSAVIDGRQVPTHNAGNLRGSPAGSDASIPAVPQRARQNLPYNNPLAQNPPIPPVPQIPSPSHRIEELPRKSGERQVPGFDPQSQSAFFPSRSRSAARIDLLTVADMGDEVVNRMFGSHPGAPMAPRIISRHQTALRH